MRGGVVERMAKKYGKEGRDLVEYQPNAELEAVFGRYPPIDTRAAESVGFRHDGSLDVLIRNCMAWRD